MSDYLLLLGLKDPTLPPEDKDKDGSDKDPAIKLYKIFMDKFGPDWPGIKITFDILQNDKKPKPDDNDPDNLPSNPGTLAFLLDGGMNAIFNIFIKPKKGEPSEPEDDDGTPELPD